MSEASKIKPKIEKYLQGEILDIGCGDQKITPDAIGVDARPLPGVDIVSDWENMLLNLKDKYGSYWQQYDVVFSSHFLEHIPDQYGAIEEWAYLLKRGGYFILYLPDGRYYNNQDNPEHMIDMKYDDFMFWFKRSFCGEGKDYRGGEMLKTFELVEHGLDIGEDRYSFYVVARHV
jgi:SAM-dependent methyltransferase